MNFTGQPARILPWKADPAAAAIQGIAGQYWPRTYSSSFSFVFSAFRFL
jgi:hypothetical protein